MPISEAMTTVNVRGRDCGVHYWQDGAHHRQTMLLLHGGFGHAWAHWSEVMPLLAETHRVIAPDLPGYGQSDALPDMRVEALLEWLKAFYGALGMHHALLVGHSFGGLIARLFAARERAAVSTLVLVNGGVIPSVGGLGKIAAGLPVIGGVLFNRISASTSTRAQLEKAVGNRAVLTSSFISAVAANRGGLARFMHGLTRSTIPAARAPRVPVLLLWGEADTISPLATAEQIRANIPSARLHPITGCGHLPMLEAPDVFAAQIALFLQQQARPATIPNIRMLGQSGKH